MPLEIIRNDITRMNVDAIVNAANSRLQQGGGVCGAIFAKAGAQKLQAECDSIGYCAAGSAVITGGYALPAKHIIHTVGPVWQGGAHQEEALLSSCYMNSLELAVKHGLTSVAFPLISSGIFGYPKDEALRIAISSIGNFLLKHDIMIYLVVFDKAAYKISDKLFISIETYINDKYVDSHTVGRSQRDSGINLQFREMQIYESDSCSDVPMCAPPAPRNLKDVVSNVSESFTEMLIRLIDERGKSDPEVYKRANLDRKLFSKIRSNVKYKPSKNTALALAIALELNLDETTDLLRRAGFALSPSSRFDLIVEYFIREGNYDVFEINEALFAFDESLLGVGVNAG